jgi:hypothetical protein
VTHQKLLQFSSLPYLADRFTDAGTCGALLSARVLSLKAMKMGFMDEPSGRVKSIYN